MYTKCLTTLGALLVTRASLVCIYLTRERENPSVSSSYKKESEDKSTEMKQREGGRES